MGLIELVVGKWKQVLIGLLVVIALCSLSFYKGMGYQKALQAQAQVKVLEKAAERKDQQQAVTDKHEAAQVVTQEKIRTVYKYIDRKVIEYVESHPAKCQFADDWVRLYNSAATAVPDSPGVAASEVSANPDNHAAGTDSQREHSADKQD